MLTECIPHTSQHIQLVKQDVLTDNVKNKITDNKLGMAARIASKHLLKYKVLISNNLKP